MNAEGVQQVPSPEAAIDTMGRVIVSLEASPTAPFTLFAISFCKAGISIGSVAGISLYWCAVFSRIIYLIHRFPFSEINPWASYEFLSQPSFMAWKSRFSQPSA